MEVSGVFNLPVSQNWKQSQTRKEVLDCLSNVGVTTINLPKISDVLAANAGGVQIFINDKDNNASVNNITINAGGGNTIDISGLTAVTIEKNGGTIVLKISSSTEWIAVESSPAATPGTPSKILKGFFNQAGAAAPTVNPLVDTITGIAYEHVSLGLYKGVKAGAFKAGKVFFIPPTNYNGSIGQQQFSYEFSMFSDTDDEFFIQCKRTDGLGGTTLDLTDGILFDGYSGFVIEIYD